MNFKRLFAHYEGIVPSIIDFIHPKTGLSLMYVENLHEIQKRYSGAFIMEYDDYMAKREAALISAPVEISEKQFINMFEVLPPVSWINHGDTESFKLSERTSGSITAICCRIQKRFFKYENKITMPHEMIVATCMPLYKTLEEGSV